MDRLRSWAMGLSMRQQNTLLDSVDRVSTRSQGPQYALMRLLRAMVLQGPPVRVGRCQLAEALLNYRRAAGGLIVEYALRVMHAVKTIGYKGDDPYRAVMAEAYVEMCRDMHVNPETEQEMDSRR